MPSRRYTEDLLDKIRASPDDEIAEAADFVDFLELETDEQQVASAVTTLSRQASHAHVGPTGMGFMQ